MSDIKTVDCRGLSCPQPALLARQTLGKLDKGVVEVLVDNSTARENVCRVAQGAGWKVSVEEQPDGVSKLVIKK